ncbi:MAG: ATP-binding cassette domain-containing protein [bacterium]|nr:ATP-binding cassette domain-containing protein [bacterium]
MENGTQKILEVGSIKKHFPIQKGFFQKKAGVVKAVDNVSLYVNEGETLGLVGESGCGKTTLGRCIVRIYDPTDGSITFRFSEGESIDITRLEQKRLRPLRKDIQMIFQDPYASLNPRMTILDIVGEPLIYHKIAQGKALEDRVKELMDIVGLEIKHIKRYPHAFSGGQRQRIGIARALATNPKFVVADEAVSALDVSIQAQILNLLQDLQEEFHLTYLFIAHDLSVIQHISDRVAVMYVGKMVEMAATDALFIKPKHPYTEALLSAIPLPDPEVEMQRMTLPGEVANPANPPSGCYFHPRCVYAQGICHNETPRWEEVAPGHFAACHFAKKLDLKGVE